MIPDPVVPDSALAPDSELPQPGLVNEWVFAAWEPDGSLGIISGHRLAGPGAWYWSALVEAGQPLLHLADWDVVVRAVDPFIVKAPEMWAEHQLDAPMEQWSIGNEAYFTALADPADALGRAYGTPTPVAMDLEWYATGPATEIAYGYEQSGLVHGEIELMHRPNIEVAEIPAHRWRRFAPDLPGGIDLGPCAQTDTLSSETVLTETVPTAPFRFPDGRITTWALAPTGWHNGDAQRVIDEDHLIEGHLKN